MTDRADLLAAARDLNAGLARLGFPLIGEAVLWDVEHMAKAPLARGAEARRLLAEGERLATRLQGNRTCPKCEGKGYPEEWFAEDRDENVCPDCEGHGWLAEGGE